MTDQVDRGTIDRRMSEARKLAIAVGRQERDSRVGHTVRVLLERVSSTEACGLSREGLRVSVSTNGTRQYSRGEELTVELKSVRGTDMIGDPIPRRKESKVNDD